MARILIAGDLVIDNYLLRLPGARLGYSELLPKAVMTKVRGNAWYLKELTEIACSDFEGETEVELLRPKAEIEDSSSLAQAYSIWSPFAEEAGSKDKVWRIEEFLGCYKAQNEPGADDYQLYDLGGEGGADLLIIDDENMGFRDNDALWEKALGFCNTGTRILYKAVPPLAQGGLWNQLISDYADKLTMVLPAGFLRAQDVAISEPLSWDMAIEELDREFRKGRILKSLSSLERVLIYYKGAGVACYSGGKLERFVYHPDELEGMWHARRPGKTFGDTSILTAAMSRHMIAGETYPLFIAASRALEAVRAHHASGAGKVRGPVLQDLVDSFDMGTGAREIKASLHPSEETVTDKLPEERFRAAFPRSLIGADKDEEPLHSDLLQDFTGAGYEYVAAKAMQVVLEGPEKALASVPKARYGAYSTVDREEIERINEIRELISSYRASAKDAKPLSIAVFGPPGSGKSFAIKQLASELFGKEQKPLEFNLSQLDSREELHQAFHQVRDASVRGSIPLVFWDEFDTGDLKWLKEFLAPMQDSEFREASLSHPFGKAIFIFAGGTCQDFESFEMQAKENRAAKGPDFVSRLRGYVNIKGPNRYAKSNVAEAEAEEVDVAHLIRRAILLRSIITRYHPQLIDPATGNASIGPSVVRGFLRVQEFLHGARSLESVVSMSSLAGCDYFGVAELPSTDLLSLHVTPDFMDKMREGEIETETVEGLAEACHEAWRSARAELFGETAEDNPLLVPYSELEEGDKEANRLTARVTKAKFMEIGYELVPVKEGEAQDFSDFSEQERDFLIAKEHEIWMRDKLLRGFGFAGVTRKEMRLHRDIKPFSEITMEDKKLDEAIAKEMPRAIMRAGYRLEKVTGSNRNQQD